MMSNMIRLLVTIIFLLTCSVAFAESTHCIAIPQLPYTISKEGVYCLLRNMSTKISKGNAITIETGNVTLDLKGWSLGGQAAGKATRTIGIYAFNRRNITIRNGTIRGFYKGIHLDSHFPHSSSGNHLIENLRLYHNTWKGIEAEGESLILRNNQIQKIDGVRSAQAANGITIAGNGIRVLNNDISDMYSNHSSTAVWAFDVENAVIKDNRIDNVITNNTENTPVKEGIGLFMRQSRNVVIESNQFSRVSWAGVYTHDSSNMLIADNRITDAERGVFIDSMNEADGKYRDNLVNGVSIPYEGGTDLGGNN